MLTITKIFEFAAAHHLPEYDGPCHQTHGHTYKLEVTVGGTPMVEGPKSGMILDFSILKMIVQRVILDRVDHTTLNHLFKNPTAEIMVRWVFEELREEFKFVYLNNPKYAYGDLHLVKVRLWESSNSYAEYSEGK